jgi:phospholipid/cholesterol/gamma-HCH transport system substrate-binding protein
MRSPSARIGLAITLVLMMIAGIVEVVRFTASAGRTNVVGYFGNSNGVYEGDDVLVLGIPVGKIAKIEPQPDRVKISFWYEDRYKVPADAKAVIVSPSLVTARNIQLTPAYTGGPVMGDGAVIPQQRTAVPEEFDDLRQQLEKLTEMLQPTQPGGVSTLGSFVNTAAANLHGRGADIRDTILKLSQAVSALGDHSDDLFSTIKNLSILASALRDSSGLLSQLNQNLAAVTGVLSNDPTEVGDAVRDLNDVVADVRSFVADNREVLSTTSDKLASVSQAVVDSLDDVKQTLHVIPTVVSNVENMYQPAQSTISGVLALNNFANIIQFLCGGVQAASRLGAEQSAKLCVQYMAPIIKNRQYNFVPLGLNPFVGTSARPNEITHSEDRLRPDYIPPQPPSAASPPPAVTTPSSAADRAAGVPAPSPAHQVVTDPARGLPGMMVPPTGGQ